MKDKTTILNEFENEIKSKVMSGGEYIQEKTYKGAHNLAKGTESLVEHALDGLNYIEGKLKLK